MIVEFPNGREWECPLCGDKFPEDSPRAACPGDQTPLVRVTAVMYYRP